MKKKYNVAKINIVAHSYGGLIAHAYILNIGEQFNKKFGGYEDSVDRVVYIQTPFYGSSAPRNLLTQMAQDTDYGPMKNANAIVESITMGSEWISRLDTQMRLNNPYGPEGVMALNLVSQTDDIVMPHLATIAGILDRVSEDALYVVLNNYRHSMHDQSASTGDADRGTIAYIENPTQENFISVTSFLDRGYRWQRVSNREIDDTSFLMVNFTELDAYKDIRKNDVQLDFVKNISSSSTISPAAGGIGTAANKNPETYYNEDSNTWVFYDFQPGVYNLKIKNRDNKGVDQDFTFVNRDQVGFTYNPVDNELLEGETKANSDLQGLFVLPAFRVTELLAENAVYDINGLNQTNWEIEFTVTEANDGAFDKGRPVVIYNRQGDSGSGWNRNGGRVEAQLRGWAVHNNDFVHSSKLTYAVVIDKNKSGSIDDSLGEFFEEKSEPGYDWKDEVHRIKMRIKTDANGWTTASCWVDDKLVASHEFSGSYWNPDPILSIGGRRHNLDYQAPVNCLITDLVIRNLGGN